MVTHDVEFAAEYAHRVMIVFDGVVACDGSREVLGESIFMLRWPDCFWGTARCTMSMRSS